MAWSGGGGSRVGGPHLGMWGRRGQSGVLLSSFQREAWPLGSAVVSGGASAFFSGQDPNSLSLGRVAEKIQDALFS